MFTDPFALTFNDPDHSLDETRFITIGTASKQRILFLSHADRGKDRVSDVWFEQHHGASVNQALRSYLRTSRGKLADKAPQPTSRKARRPKSKRAKPARG